MMGALCWNEGMNQLTKEKNQKQAKVMFCDALKFFKCISQKILPSWQPACRAVYQLYEGGTRTLTFPDFLIGDNWQGWVKLCRAMVQRCNMERALTESSVNVISKVATGGYGILNGTTEKLEPREAAQFFETQRLAFKWYAISYWAKVDEEAEKVGKKIKALKAVYEEMQKLKATGWPNLEDVKLEAERWEKLNSSVYFQAIPKEYDENALLLELPTADLTTGLVNDLDCCVV
jgi:hypothetical protein